MVFINLNFSYEDFRVIEDNIKANATAFFVTFIVISRWLFILSLKVTKAHYCIGASRRKVEDIYQQKNVRGTDSKQAQKKLSFESKS